MYVHVYALIISVTQTSLSYNQRKTIWCSYGNEGLRAHVAAIAEKCNPDYQKI